MACKWLGHNLPRLMSLSSELSQQHLEVTRRYFLQLGAVGFAVLKPLQVRADSDQALLNEATADLGYFTPQDDFSTIERGDPLPYQLPLAKRLEVGLERETWKLDVIPDSKSNPEMGNPLSRAKGNALDLRPS